jgi:nucleotide-binding universal stress UspA family protein
MKFKPAQKPGKLVVELDQPESLASLTRPLSPIQLKKILVPTDFSEVSRQALRYAIPFAREFGATVILLFVAQLSFPGSEFVDVNLAKLETDMREGAVQQLQQWSQHCVAARLPVQTLVRIGAPVEEIVRAAQELDVDVIIMSTHGHTGLAHALLGSITEKVVRHARCPVLVVRPKEHEFVKES